MLDRIYAEFPDLAGRPHTPLNQGWDSAAIDIDGEFIFKFPRNIGAAESLRREARFLKEIGKRLTLPVPELTIYGEGKSVFSRHRKIPGNHLVTAEYEELTETHRRQLAEDIARFYWELHQIPLNTMAALGASHIPDWTPAEELLRDLRDPLTPAEFLQAETALHQWAGLPPDPLGVVYGFFDGHGWNMAFDHAAGRLNGIYDFADSGLGARHREFIYTGFISADLTRRVVASYENLSGLALDRERIHLLVGVQFLSELAGLPANPIPGSRAEAARTEAMIRHNAQAWLDQWTAP